MAERRMLAKTIIESDMFSNTPAETQMLYVRLNMAADDDGFVSNPRQIMRMCGASEESMKQLIKKKFVLSFDVGDDFIFLIKHWRIHNYIQKDRYKASNFKNILREVYYDENKSYSLTPGEGKTPVIPDSDPKQISDVSKMDTDRIQDVSKMDTQDRIGKDSIGKGSLEEESIDEDNNKNNPIYLSSLDEKPAEKNLEDRRAYYQKHITWYRQNNINTEYLLRMAAEEGITDL